MTLEEAKSLASNIVGKNNTVYTTEMFSVDFPQFFKLKKVQGQEDEKEPLLPQTMLDTYIEMAADAIQETRWNKKWRLATGLYIAHYATLYLRSYQEISENNNIKKALKSGTVIGNVSSAGFGDQSIGYDNNAITKGTEQWGTWNSTPYGQQLITEAKLLGKGGSYII